MAGMRQTTMLLLDLYGGRLAPGGEQHAARSTTSDPDITGASCTSAARPRGIAASALVRGQGNRSGKSPPPTSRPLPFHHRSASIRRAPRVRIDGRTLAHSTSTAAIVEPKPPAAFRAQGLQKGLAS